MGNRADVPGVRNLIVDVTRHASPCGLRNARRGDRLLPQTPARSSLAGEPVDPLIGTEVARHGDRWVLNLIDKATDVAIRNVLSWHDGDGSRHPVISLRDLWVYSFNGAIGEPEARQLVDGRTVVQISEDDGTVRHLVIDNEGNPARLTADQCARPRTAWRPRLGSMSAERAGSAPILATESGANGSSPATSTMIGPRSSTPVSNASYRRARDGWTTS